MPIRSAAGRSSDDGPAANQSFSRLLSILFWRSGLDSSPKFCRKLVDTNQLIFLNEIPFERGSRNLNNILIYNPMTGNSDLSDVIIVMGDTSHTCIKIGQIALCSNLMATMIEAIIMGTIMPMTLVILSERAVQLADGRFQIRFIRGISTLGLFS